MNIPKILMNAKFKASKAKVFERNLEEYFNITRTEEMKKRIEQIRGTSDKAERRKLKSELPIRCPHYFRFRNDHRAQADIIPEEFTFQTCVDIDDETQVEQALSRAYLLDKEEGLWQGKLLHAEYSASGKLHLDIRMPKGMTITETQEAYCKALDVDFDADCCSPERMIYITDEDSQLYTSTEWQTRLSDEELAERRKAFEERGLDIDGRERKSAPTQEGKISLSSNEGENAAVANDELKTQPVDVKQYPDSYEDIPYTLIVEELTDQMGGAPAHGSRNDFIFRMACHLRHVCNNDAQWIRQVLPDFGEDHDRVTETIKSACKRKQSAAMSNKMKLTLDLCRRQLLIENADERRLLMQEPKLPQRLPSLLREIVMKMPEKYRPAVCCSIFPALAMRLGGVKLEYVNNTQMESTLMCVLAAPMASGKSCIKLPIEILLKDIVERDNLSREREQEWRDAMNTLSSDTNKPVRPQDLCRQVVDSDMTNAAFTQLMMDAEQAGDKCLYIILDEIEDLLRLGNGNRMTIDGILKRNFDTDMYGQERVGTKSVCGRAHLRTCMNISTTPGRLKKFFVGNVTDGTLSRFFVATIVDDDDDDEIPVYGRFDEKFEKRIRAYLSKLDDAPRLIVCAQAKRMAKDLIKLANDRAAMLDFVGYKKLARRSVVIAFRMACILYIMNGCKWSKEIEHFCRWAFDYDMWCKMRFFYEAIEKDIDYEEKAVKRGRPNLLDQLNETFTRDDARAMRIRMGLKDANPTNMLAKWVQRGFIVYDDVEKVYRKTPDFLARKLA